ncbi:MAG: Uma2 family endonuclease [Bacteroidota bacterium]
MKAEVLRNQLSQIPTFQGAKERLLNREEYYLMAKAEILGPGEKVELLAGKIYTMSPVGSRHAMCVNRLTALLIPLVGEKFLVSVQNPITLSEQSEPEPDLALWKPPFEKYEQQLPDPAEVRLVIEVADSALTKDRDLKLPLYAEAGIEEVWLVDLAKEQIEVYTQPSGNLYTLRRIIQRGGEVELLGESITMERVFGEKRA